MTINLSAHVARLRALHIAGGLTRGDWTGEDADGRVTVCLLAAIAPETGVVQSPNACPAEVMPQWLAHLVPWFDDSGTAAAWDAMVARFGALARRWHVLTEEDWRRLEFQVRGICAREAATHTQSADAIASCARVAGWDDPAAAEWAVDAADAAALAAADASAMKTAVWAVVSASVRIDPDSLLMVTADAAAAGAAQAAADRMTGAIFDVIQTRIAGRIQVE